MTDRVRELLDHDRALADRVFRCNMWGTGLFMAALLFMPAPFPVQLGAFLVDAFAAALLIRAGWLLHQRTLTLRKVESLQGRKR